MGRLHIHVLPHIVNAMVMTSIFSAGNGLLFSATRTLHGMSLQGHAPSFLSYCTKGGVPLYALAVSLAFCCLAFTQLSSSAADTLSYLVDLVTSCQLINYLCTAITYRHFFSSLKKQGICRDSLPYKGRFQPYTSYFAMAGTTFMLLAAGYDLFITGGWSIKWFFLDYGMIGFFIVLAVGWKVVRRSSYVRPGTADLTIGGLKDEIDQYEALFTPRETGRFEKQINKLF